MGETVQKIQAFSLSIAFMDKSRQGWGGLRGERNQSVFDPVYTVVLTVHSTFRKAARVLCSPSTCGVTTPHNFTAGGGGG